MNCPHCDQEIPNKSEFCIFCGEKIAQKKRPKAIITLSILLAISLALAGGELIYILIKGQQTSQLINNYEHNMAIRKNRINELEDEIAQLEDKAHFYDTLVAIIPSDGSGLYHKYGCEYLDLSKFKGFDYTGEAEYKGYSPCPYCH